MNITYKIAYWSIGFVLLYALTTEGSSHNDDLRIFFNAIRQVETGGEPNDGRDTIGAAGEIGPYQITYAYWLDSNVKGEWKLCKQKAYAEKVMLAYWKRYDHKALKNKDLEILARIHNGGPRGYEKESTIPYWEKVKKILK